VSMRRRRRPGAPPGRSWLRSMPCNHSTLTRKFPGSSPWRRARWHHRLV
jgi:hypothetical protein